MRRRDLIILGGAAAGAAGFSKALRWYGARFEFTDIAGLPGFRRLDRGQASLGAAMLIGVERPDVAVTDAMAAVRRDPCGALFGGPVMPGDPLPVAVFSDYFCPYCAVLSRRLAEVVRGRSDLRLVLHELPLLRPRSETLARVALAASRQGAHWAAHLFLMERAMPPGAAAIRDMAARLDLDGDRLIADMDSDAVTGALRRSAALAQVFGIVATPGTVFGRTLVVGAVERQDIKRLIELELSEPSAVCN